MLLAAGDSLAWSQGKHGTILPGARKLVAVELEYSLFLLARSRGRRGAVLPAAGKLVVVSHGKNIFEVDLFSFLEISRCAKHGALQEFFFALADRSAGQNFVTCRKAINENSAHRLSGRWTDGQNIEIAFWFSAEGSDRVEELAGQLSRVH